MSRVGQAARTVLKFPENREFNREFSGFSPESALLGVDSRSHFNGLQVNSLLFAKVGDFVAISMRCRQIP
jgi:hypothetical protein